MKKRQKTQGRVNFDTLIEDLRITKREAQQILGRSRQTIERWRREGAPIHITPLLLIAAGHLDHQGPAWAGWRISHGKLHAPQLATPFEPHHLYGMHWEIQKAKAETATARAERDMWRAVATALMRPEEKSVSRRDDRRERLRR